MEQRQEVNDDAPQGVSKSGICSKSGCGEEGFHTMKKEDQQDPIDLALKSIRDAFEDYKHWFVDNMNRPQEVTASRVVKLEIMRERLRSQMDAAEQELTKAMIARHIDEGKLLQSKKANLQKEG